MKATFFMTFTMVDGWVGMGGEALQLWYLLLFQLKVQSSPHTPFSFCTASLSFSLAVPSPYSPLPLPPFACPRSLAPLLLPPSHAFLCLLCLLPRYPSHEENTRIISPLFSPSPPSSPTSLFSIRPLLALITARATTGRQSSLLVRTPADRIKAMKARPIRLVDTISQVPPPLPLAQVPPPLPLAQVPPPLPLAQVPPPLPLSHVSPPLPLSQVPPPLLLSQLYFLLPFVYCVTNPLYLPFALAFYILAFVIYRNQIINVYCSRYEMAGAFWPHFDARLVAAMLVQQVTLGGILSLKDAPSQACCLLPLPFVTLIVHWAFIRGQFSSTFSKLALEEANRKDTIDRTVHPNEDPHSFLARAYLHPSLQSAFTMLDGDEEQGGAGRDDSSSSSSSDDDDKDGDEEEGGGKKSKHADRHAQTRLVPVKRHPFSSSAQASPAVPNGSDGLQAVAGSSPPAHLRPRSVSDGPGSSASAAAVAVSAVTSAAAAAASAAFAAARSAASSGAAAFSAASSGRVAADADATAHTPHAVPPASRDRSSEASPYHSCELVSVIVDGPEDVSQNVPLATSSAARPDFPVGDSVVQRGAAAASEGMTGGSRGERKPSPQTAGTEPLLAGGGGDRGGESSGMGKAVGVPVFRL
ncbi:unnamed protein product [Closterium sp. Naga37s-1]|nr:unnamed protein product [Closterium sp. Naga37s-1]